MVWAAVHPPNIVPASANLLLHFRPSLRILSPHERAQGASNVQRLMISVSGVRGIVGEGLVPEVVLGFAQAFGTYVEGAAVVLGRDSRVTGEMLKHAALAGLNAAGCDVIDLGVVPTPTVQLATERLPAEGGLIITASHNPIMWNGLKLLASDGLFLDADQAAQVLDLREKQAYSYASYDRLGKVEVYDRAVDDHIKAILDLPYLDVDLIRRRRFKVALDCVCGAGAVLVPRLLKELGCQVIPIHCEPTGRFPRNPEPLPENLGELCTVVRQSEAAVGFAVDPDSDRLAIVSEKGQPLGEEYTLVLAVQFLLQKKRGPVVVNVSTTRAIEDIAGRYGADVVRTKVGEIHVAKRMREVGAVIGGEGNGGVILPDVHLGRDAPVGIALTLQHLAEFEGPMSELFSGLPQYVMSKQRIELTDTDPKRAVEMLRDRYSNERLDLTDGVKIVRERSWVHVRPSNTEPILRVMSEAPSREEADKLAADVMRQVESL
jgi:phosphomannomutase